MKRVVLLLTFLYFFLAPSAIYASSNYVLPYPPIMPGGMLYKIRVFNEKIKKHWSFGDFAQHKYNLEQSDKYLVQAKVLFEYKQYLLGFQSLKKSNDFISQAAIYLVRAKENKKNISDKEKIFKNALEKHKEVLIELLNNTPGFIKWQPENDKESNLEIRKLIQNSIYIRETYL